MACGLLTTLILIWSSSPAATLTPDEERMINRAVEIGQTFVGAGWPEEELRKLIAVSMAESTAGLFPEGDLDRVGEPTADGRTWGMSYGPLHIRTILEDTGTGSIRDIERLRDPREYAKAALELFQAEGWGPWASTKSIKGREPRYVSQMPYASVVERIMQAMESGVR